MLGYLLVGMMAHATVHVDFIQKGDRHYVIIEKDTSMRIVEVTDEYKEALKTGNENKILQKVLKEEK